MGLRGNESYRAFVRHTTTSSTGKTPKDRMQDAEHTYLLIQRTRKNSVIASDLRYDAGAMYRGNCFALWLVLTTRRADTLYFLVLPTRE